MNNRINLAEGLIKKLMQASDQPIPNLDFDPQELNLDFDPSALTIDFDAPAPDVKQPAPAPATAHSTRTSIRIPGDVLDAFKAEAGRKGSKYQTLIVRELRKAIKGWP
jgi:uncharacterized protein (DUF4415 family)